MENRNDGEEEIWDLLIKTKLFGNDKSIYFSFRYKTIRNDVRIDKIIN